MHSRHCLGSCVRNHNRSSLVLDSEKGVGAFTTPLNSLYDLDRRSQSCQRYCHCWKLQDEPFAFPDDLGAACIFATRYSMCTLSVYRCMRLEGMKEVRCCEIFTTLNVDRFSKLRYVSRAGLKGRGARGNFYWRAPVT